MGSAKHGQVSGRFEDDKRRQYLTGLGHVARSLTGLGRVARNLI